jgi:hypothetical protein
MVHHLWILSAEWARSWVIHAVSLQAFGSPAPVKHTSQKNKLTETAILSLQLFCFMQ